MQLLVKDSDFLSMESLEEVAIVGLDPTKIVADLQKIYYVLKANGKILKINGKLAI